MFFALFTFVIPEICNRESMLIEYLFLPNLLIFKKVHRVVVFLHFIINFAVFSVSWHSLINFHFFVVIASRRSRRGNPASLPFRCHPALDAESTFAVAVSSFNYKLPFLLCKILNIFISILYKIFNIFIS